MARYIDADELREYWLENGVNENVYNTNDVLNSIDYQPTADVVEVKHGFWKRNERNIPKMREFHEKGIALSMSEKSIFYTCPCCDSWGSLMYNYCPNCGAKMDGGNAE